MATFLTRLTVPRWFWLRFSKFLEYKRLPKEFKMKCTSKCSKWQPFFKKILKTFSNTKYIFYKKTQKIIIHFHNFLIFFIFLVLAREKPPFIRYNCRYGTPNFCWLLSICMNHIIIQEKAKQLFGAKGGSIWKSKVYFLHQSLFPSSCLQLLLLRFWWSYPLTNI